MLSRLFGIALLGVVACTSATEPPVPSGGGGGPTTSSAPPVASAEAPPKKGRSLPDGKDEAPRVALGTHGAVASQEANASDVGIEILKKGGNAVDAAVAVGFALAVTHPSAGNIGGGGFMIVRTATGSNLALDFRETAPSGASRDMYLDKKGNPTKDSLNGPKAAGIPGSVAGLFAAHQKLGKLGWKEVVAPSIKLAKEGFKIDEQLSKDIVEVTKKMKDLGFDATAKAFSRADGLPLAPGDKLIQPDLAKTLEAIAENPRSFYEGPIAETMAREVTKAGGVWKAEDLKKYEAKWRDPIVFEYRGHQVVTMPPPSAGGVVLKQLLAASEAMDLKKKAWRSADEIHLFAEVMRRTYADRNALLGDPDFVKMPMAEMLDTSYVKKRIADIDPLKATPSSQIKAGIEPSKQESTQTTHYSVVDEEGNAVAVTTTLNTGFGAKFMVPGVGVLLNNEMDDFAVKPGTPNVFGLVQGEQNKIEPGKRMLSSMTPTIVSKDGQLRAVIGSPGGPTITTTVAQVVRALIDYDKPLDVAVPAFRAHHQWLPDQIWTEESMPADVQAELEKRGHKIAKRGRIGHANSIEIDPKSRGFRAVADTTRASGKAAAY